MRRASFGLLLLFVVTIPLEDTVELGFGRISKVLGFLAVGAWLLTAVARGRVRRPAPAMTAAALFVAWAAASYFWSPDQSLTLAKVATLVQMVAVVWLIWDQVGTRDAAVWVMRAFVGGALVAAVVTIGASLGGNAVHGARFSVADAGPNNTGCLLAISVAVAWHLFSVERGRREAVLYVVAIPFLSLGVLLTASRTALLSLALGVVVIALDRRNLAPRRLVPVVVAALLVGVLVAQLLPERTAARLGTTGTELAGGTLNERTTYWKIAFDVFSDHPVTGVGAGAFKEASGTVEGKARLAHNMFLSTLAELGSVGLGLLLLTLALAAFELRRAAAGVARTWAPVAATWLVGASALTWEVRKVTWLLLGLTLVQHAVGTRTIASSAPRARAASR